MGAAPAEEARDRQPDLAGRGGQGATIGLVALEGAWVLGTAPRAPPRHRALAEARGDEAGQEPVQAAFQAAVTDGSTGAQDLHDCGELLGRARCYDGHRRDLLRMTG